jgi:hypothetical protein
MVAIVNVFCCGAGTLSSDTRLPDRPDRKTTGISLPNTIACVRRCGKSALIADVSRTFVVLGLWSLGFALSVALDVSLADEEAEPDRLDKDEWWVLSDSVARRVLLLSTSLTSVVVCAGRRL